MYVLFTANVCMRFFYVSLGFTGPSGGLYAIAVCAIFTISAELLLAPAPMTARNNLRDKNCDAGVVVCLSSATSIRGAPSQIIALLPAQRKIRWSHDLCRD